MNTTLRTFYGKKDNNFKSQQKKILAFVFLPLNKILFTC